MQMDTCVFYLLIFWLIKAFCFLTIVGNCVEEFCIAEFSHASPLLLSAKLQFLFVHVSKLNHFFWKDDAYFFLCDLSCEDHQVTNGTWLQSDYQISQTFSTIETFLKFVCLHEGDFASRPLFIILLRNNFVPCIITKPVHAENIKRENM